MIDSNYYILSHYKLKPDARDKRLKYLHDTLTQLQAYHQKAKPSKQGTIARLICAYDELLEKITGD